MSQKEPQNDEKNILFVSVWKRASRGRDFNFYFYLYTHCTRPI